MSKSIFIYLLSSILSSIAVAEENYPQFRGLGGRGVVQTASIPEDWTVESYLDWEKEIPGSGWSQPIIWNQRVFLTSAVASNDLRPKSFAESVRLPQSMGLAGGKPKFEITWTVFCLDARTGKKIWERAIETSKPQYSVHPSNTFATETPAADQNGIYVYFGALGKIVSYSFSGEIRWSKEVGEFRTSNSFGTGSSLAIGDGMVYLQNFNEENANLWCFNTESGQVVWKKARERKGTSWSTPIIWKNQARTEVIVSGGIRTNSYDPKTGDVLWTLNKVKTATACSMGSDANRIYFGGSDPFSKGPLFAVKSGASGDLSPKRTNRQFENCDWLQKSAGPGMASPVSSGEYLYVVDKDILRCYGTKDGNRFFQNRLSGMNMIVASPMVLGRHLLMVGEKGNVGVAKIGEEFSFKNVGKVDDLIWSTSAATDQAVYIRGVKKLYRIRLTSDKK